MSRKTIGIVDYSIGNHASVQHAFQSLGYLSRISHDSQLLADSDLIVLPGVGAYPTAMAALQSYGLVDFLRERARSGQPIIGFCLGMQLLADESLEHGCTAGLGLIPGRVVPLDHPYPHIGWNAIEVLNSEKMLMPSDGEFFYFNHSFMFETSIQYQVCLSRLDQSFVVGVRHGNTLGLQFHPEKSQYAGRAMLKNLVEGLTSD